MIDTSVRQRAEQENSLERLANAQLAKLADRIREKLSAYAEPKATELISDLGDRLKLASASYNDGAYLDAIEYACMGLDLKERR